MISLQYTSNPLFPFISCSIFSSDLWWLHKSRTSQQHWVHWLLLWCHKCNQRWVLYCTLLSTRDLSDKCKFITNILCSASDAYECAKMLCEQYYLGSPELELREINGEESNTFSRWFWAALNHLNFVPNCIIFYNICSMLQQRTSHSQSRYPMFLLTSTTWFLSSSR